MCKVIFFCYLLTYLTCQQLGLLKIVRFEVFTVVKLWIVVLCAVMLCSVVGGYQCFASIFKAEDRQYIPPKRW
jgi:hypothetical protein